MPGRKPSPQQGLFDDGSLIGFLQSTLQAMEAAAGGQLSEERAKLQELQLALGGLGLAAEKPIVADDLVMASQLDRLEQQLEAVEAEISNADDATKQLLTQSTAVWAGVQQGSDGGDGAAASTSESTASAANDTDTPSAAASGTCDASSGTVADGSAVEVVSLPLTTRLVPVVEQDEEETVDT